MRSKGYTTKALIQMVLSEGYTDRQIIADELGITRKHVARIIRDLKDLDLQQKILKKLK